MSDPTSSSPHATAWQDAFVALGSNLGDRAGFLRQAVAALKHLEGVRFIEASPIYETAAHTLRADEVQPCYLNAVVHLETRLRADELLAACHAIERAAGRDRSEGIRWAPRTLDLDILVIGDLVRDAPDPVVPHPRLGERRFVLQPFADIAPEFHVPSPYDASVFDILARCPDQDQPVRTADRPD